jgi:hypothetical protein
VVKLSDSARLRGTSGSGRHINGQGTLTGTIRGAVYIHLLLGPGRTFTAEANVYARKGSLSGQGAGRYQVGNFHVQFSGSVSMSRGTGRYAHARAHDLRFTGSVNLLDGAVTLRLSGALRY